ncbi:MAG TPA: hypothetical protein VHW26_03300 [Solirubrobacteraceae bacterium]|jgi:hypothetical protein|nr:hypothetical protein [Solirubrobacteraceae bacterium]
MKRLSTGSVAALACVSLGAAAAGASPLANAAANPGPRGPVAVAAAARKCKQPRYPSTGYFTGLTATNTTCSTASKLILGIYKCRTKSGLAGKCKTKVDGFKCAETRHSIPTEIDARDTCKRGSAKVVSTWQQDIS